MLSVVGGDSDPRRPSLISQAYSEPPLTPSAQRARKISVFGEDSKPTNSFVLDICSRNWILDKFAISLARTGGVTVAVPKLDIRYVFNIIYCYCVTFF